MYWNDDKAKQAGVLPLLRALMHLRCARVAKISWLRAKISYWKIATSGNFVTSTKIIDPTPRKTLVRLHTLRQKTRAIILYCS